MDNNDLSACELPDTGAPWSFRTEPSPRWVRVKFGGETIADSKRVLLAFETGSLPVYYFPKEDVRMDLLVPSDYQYACSHKGIASYWSIRVKDRVSENAAWSYLTPNPAAKEIEGYISFYWSRTDAWFEEETEVFVHARDPYTRVDAIPSSRHIQVVAGGETIADSKRPVIVFETGLVTRYYLPIEDVRPGVLIPSEKTTRCPYKGIATYWDVKVGDKVYKDAVWSYQKPVGAVEEIAGLVCFYSEEMDALYVDGQKWSLPSNQRLPYKRLEK
ncbi:DUF427 domain-containing protein [Cohnella pontilimi]|uniref:DUF427 domain-containing protein n=1 Tax=Cohnella pontilimi TaxID=2564100 RepID=A0A4U0FKM2_9BACL|nr:DUF427 domain-containing protein [Cohnella pontilimi]TJY44112.1 DUF427 domain-containing protein [Cohnella pontilimi]